MYSNEFHAIVNLPNVPLHVLVERYNYYVMNSAHEETCITKLTIVDEEGRDWRRR